MHLARSCGHSPAWALPLLAQIEQRSKDAPEPVHRATTAELNPGARILFF